MWMTAKERMEHIASVPSDEGIAALLADRAAVLERLAPFIFHTYECRRANECICGKAETIAEILERPNETR